MVGRKKITLRLSISTNIEMRQSLRQRVCVVNHCLTGIIPPLRGAAVRLFFNTKKGTKVNNNKIAKSRETREEEEEEEEDGSNFSVWVDNNILVFVLL